MTMTLPQDLSVGKRIRWARLQAGFSQAGLAAALGTTRQVVIRWEKDKHRPNAESRAKLAAATGQSLGFFTDDGDDDEEADPLMHLLRGIKALVRAEVRDAIEAT